MSEKIKNIFDKKFNRCKYYVDICKQRGVKFRYSHLYRLQKAVEENLFEYTYTYGMRFVDGELVQYNIVEELLSQPSKLFKRIVSDEVENLYHQPIILFKDNS